MANGGTEMAENMHGAAMGLAGVLFTATADAAIRAHELRMAQGDAQAARTLAAALRAERARTQRLERELADYRTRALRAEGVILKQARRA